MRVLIVEDNEFNAFCLRRLLESVLTVGTIIIANNSNVALSLFYSHPFDLVIIDGQLGASRNKACCNGPELAQILLYKYPELPIIAWTDCESMRQSFTHIFKQHDRSVNDFTLWNKTVTAETIASSWIHHFTEFFCGQNQWHPQVSAYY